MRTLLALVAALALTACPPSSDPGASDTSGSSQSGEASGSKVVHVYTHRHYDTDQALFDEFTKATGIEVKVVKAKAGSLINRLETEGANTPADLFITADAGHLGLAASKGLLQPIEDETLKQRVPANLRDAQGRWFGLTVRARVIAYHKERVKPEQLSTYEDLADPKWKGKILIRQSSNIYNQSLLASLVAHHGEAKAKAWAAGVLANVARKPQGNDRDQVKAVAAGVGDLAVVNTYYIGKLLNSSKPEEKQAGEAVALFFPNQGDRGAHINISGAGVTQHAKHKDAAIKLLHFLTDKAAQQRFAEANYEYPVNPEVKPSALLESWGAFKRDALPVGKLGEHNGAASKIFRDVSWN